MLKSKTRLILAASALAVGVLGVAPVASAAQEKRSPGIIAVVKKPAIIAVFMRKSGGDQPSY
jgi:ABC-type sugar transport system substrate-binding protein